MKPGALALGALGLAAGTILLSSKKASAEEPSTPSVTPSRPTYPASATVAPDTGTGPLSQKTYLQAALRGELELVWVDLPSAPGWQVTADAVKLDGFRFPVTPATAQHIADILGARLTTPLIEDLIEGDASAKIVSPTQDFRIMHTLGAAEAFNRGIDDQLVQLEAARNELVSCVGKSWVLTRELETKGMVDGNYAACNYGMFRPDGKYMSVTNHFKLWQQPGYRHNIDHWDYSQVLRLCRPKRPGLVVPAHDGVTITRQPGVPLTNAAIAMEA